MSTTSGDIHPLAEQRAVEAFIWGLPAVNFERMVEAFGRLGGAFNQVLYWSRPLDGHNQSLTPNPDTVYFMPFFDLTDGPVVIEVPAANRGSITGSIMNSWQCALEDVGPAGADAGAGGRYVVVPPAYDGSAGAGGDIVLHCDTIRGYALLRSNIVSGSEADVATSVAYGKRIKFHRLDEKGETSDTEFVDAAGQVFDSQIPYNREYFESLNRIVQAEPWLPRDRATIQTLETLGIVRGRPFTPAEALQRVFDKAAQTARAYLDKRYEIFFDPPFLPGTHWAVPAPKEVIEGQQSGYADKDRYPTDDRGALFSFIFFSAKRLGGGQFYLMAIEDANGAAFDGANCYRLTVPRDPPVTLYWSLTVYNRETHTLFTNTPRCSRASNAEDLQHNSDRSTDIFIGPAAPDGLESNWVPTDPAAKFEVLFRLYGPTEALFNKTWRLPDIAPS